MTNPSRKRRSFKYNALLYAQRTSSEAPRFIIFHAPARDIVEWADVDRLEPENPTGAQRPLKDLRVRKVGKFLRAQVGNTIPTAVTVALDPAAVTFKGTGREATGKIGTVEIKLGTGRPGLIIDGQHRVYGAYREMPDLHLNIVAFLEDDDSERAFQFVVINNTAARINRDHIQALNLQFDKQTLNDRLLASSGVGLGMASQKFDDLQVVDLNEPFVGLLKYPTNSQGFIAPNAIEGALAETYERAALLGMEGDEMELFLSVWNQIRRVRKSVWNAKSKLLEKVSIYALTVYLLDSMVSRQRNSDERVDFSSDAVLEEQIERVLGRIPEQFWTVEWTAKEMDTSLGRGNLINALNIIDSNARFKRPWYENVTFIKPGLLKEAAATGPAPKAKKGKGRKADAVVKKAVAKKGQKKAKDAGSTRATRSAVRKVAKKTARKVPSKR